MLILLLILAGSVKPPIELKVHPRIALAPTDVRLLIRIDPHPDNRALILDLQGPYYSTSSTFELAGEDAPALLERWFKSVRAPGPYVITAVVIRSGGKRHQASETMCLIGGEESCGR